MIPRGRKELFLEEPCLIPIGAKRGSFKLILINGCWRRPEGFARNRSPKRGMTAAGTVSKPNRALLPVQKGCLRDQHA